MLMKHVRFLMALLAGQAAFALSSLSAQETPQAPAAPAAPASTAPAPATPVASEPAAPVPAAVAPPTESAAPAAPAAAAPAAATPAPTAPAPAAPVAAATPEAGKKAEAPTPAPAPAKPAPLLPLEALTDPEVVKLFASIPVQQNGRVKPLDTVARFTLLAMHGKQTIKTTKLSESTGKEEPILDPVTGKPVVNAKGKSRLTAMEWMVVSWFRPDIAKELPVFVVDNSDAVVLLNLHGKGKRDRYSFNEIDAGREKLMEKMGQLRGMDPAKMSPEYRAIGKLSQDFLDYDMMLSHFDFARAPFGDKASIVPAEILTPGEAQNPPLSVLLPKLAAYFKAHPEAAAPMGNPWFFNFYRTVLSAMMSANPSARLTIFPPEDTKLEVWKGPGSLIQEGLSGGAMTGKDFALLEKYGQLATSTASPEAFKAKAKEVVDALTAAASARNESGHIPMEISYHRADYFYYALIFFIFGSLALGLSWVSPTGAWGRWANRVCWACMIAGAALGTVGITIRCLIMERPPITTLYETIIFISTASVIGALLVEWLTKRKGLAITVACVAGVAGMFLSIRFMDMEAKDSLQQLQAVLITNFWLSTHVPCINLGYAAGMVACICSMVYLFRRLVGVTKAGDEDARTLSRMTYAFILTGLFLSLVGTVLGGIWANYSWGRFWGWDPKENGALMIVLMNLIILHARLGGYIREAGLHVCSVLLGMITVFSWFATNQLGIGLHAYGELSGAWQVLYTTWGVMAAFMVYGMIRGYLDRKARPAFPAPDVSVREGQTRGHVTHPQAAAKS